MIKALRILGVGGTYYAVSTYNVKSIYTTQDINGSGSYYTVKFEDGGKHIIKNAATIAEY